MRKVSNKQWHDRRSQRLARKGKGRRHSGSAPFTKHSKKAALMNPETGGIAGMLRKLAMTFGGKRA